MQRKPEKEKIARWRKIEGSTLWERPAPPAGHGRQLLPKEPLDNRSSGVAFGFELCGGRGGVGGRGLGFVTQNMQPLLLSRELTVRKMEHRAPRPSAERQLDTKKCEKKMWNGIRNNSERVFDVAMHRSRQMTRYVSIQKRSTLFVQFLLVPPSFEFLLVLVARQSPDVHVLLGLDQILPGFLHNFVTWSVFTGFWREWEGFS